MPNILGIERGTTNYCMAGMEGGEPPILENSEVFFFNDTATTEIYTLSLHDALPICSWRWPTSCSTANSRPRMNWRTRSEEHTSELQSLRHLVCRLLLEKKTQNK